MQTSAVPLESQQQPVMTDATGVSQPATAIPASMGAKEAKSLKKVPPAELFRLLQRYLMLFCCPP